MEIVVNGYYLVLDTAMTWNGVGKLTQVFFGSAQILLTPSLQLLS